MPKPACKMNETKLEINENYEEAELSDVDDDVFVRSGGRNGYRLEYDTAKKPLMTPRKKQVKKITILTPHPVEQKVPFSCTFNKGSYTTFGLKNGGLHTEVRSSPPVFQVICLPICYILIATMAMLGIIVVVVFLVGHMNFTWPRGLSKLWSNSKVLERLIPCDNLIVEDVWIRQFPKFLTESSFRTLDVNGDGVEDIILGFATGADGLDVPDFVCDIYFGGQKPCFGGVLALDGRNGSELWRHWTQHEVFAINCNEDLTKDGVHDCLIAGRAGVFCAINAKNGSLLWSFPDGPARDSKMNFYTPQFIRDLNGDGVVDVVTCHGGDPLADQATKNRRVGRIILVNGKTGEVLQWVETPDKRETYYSPQILTRGQDGADYLLFGTGGETNGGGLYIILLTDLYKGLIANAKAIYKDEFKGVMVPPVITDVNGDGIDDIVMAMFNSTVIAFNGNNLEQLWNYTFPSSETYTTPTPGYFNQDDTPDFLVKYQTGPGFPVYYQAKTTIMDGKTGKPLLENPILDSIGSQASTPLIRMEGVGNDLFLYWSSNCKGYEGNSTEFNFVKGTNVHEQSRSDFCKLRFDSKLINQLRAFNSKIGVPGSVIYDSESRAADEYNNKTDTSQEGQAYLRAHPQMWSYFGQNNAQTQLPQTPQYSDYKESQTGVLGSHPIYNSPNNGMSFDGVMNPGSLMDNYPNPLGGGNGYDMSSQPELTEEVKYPVYHSVRKHGKFTMPGNGQLQQQQHQQQQQQQGQISGASSVNSRRGGSYSMNGNGPQALPPMIPPQDGGGFMYNNYYDGRNKYPIPGVIPMDNKRGGYSPDPNYGGTFDSILQWGRGRTAGMGMEQVGGQFGFQYGDPKMRRMGMDERSRVKRHVGPHDIDGIQRLISTGTLAAPLGNRTDGIDLIFATYWFYPAKTSVEGGKPCGGSKKGGGGGGGGGGEDDILQYDERRDCPDQMMMMEEDPVVTDRAEEGDRTFESQATYNPFDIHMGQMTVYRLHINCNCTTPSAGVAAAAAAAAAAGGGGGKNDKSKNIKFLGHERCAKILPINQQPWSGYMGSRADSYFSNLAPGQELLRFFNLV